MVDWVSGCCTCSPDICIFPLALQTNLMVGYIGIVLHCQLFASGLDVAAHSLSSFGRLPWQSLTGPNLVIIAIRYSSTSSASAMSESTKKSELSSSVSLSVSPQIISQGPSWSLALTLCCQAYYLLSLNLATRDSSCIKKRLCSFKFPSLRGSSDIQDRRRPGEFGFASDLRGGLCKSSLALN